MDKRCSAARRRVFRIGVLAWLASSMLPTAAFAESPQRSPAATVAERGGGPARHHDERCAAGTDAFARTELFFGLSRPGGVITEADFKAFVDARVTPRFPDGLTLLSGSGQFRDSSGAILVEGAKVLILLVPRRDAQANDKIEAIRSDYRQQFQQQSVLRADAGSCVSF
jgi:Protein of unknown function (DUF3574)